MSTQLYMSYTRKIQQRAICFHKVTRKETSLVKSISYCSHLDFMLSTSQLNKTARWHMKLIRELIRNYQLDYDRQKEYCFNSTIINTTRSQPIIIITTCLFFFKENIINITTPLPETIQTFNFKKNKETHYYQRYLDS